MLTYEEFNTLIVQVEGALNSRPLTPLSGRSEDRQIRGSPDPNTRTSSNWFLSLIHPGTLRTRPSTKKSGPVTIGSGDVPSILA